MLTPEEKFMQSLECCAGYDCCNCPIDKNAGPCFHTLAKEALAYIRGLKKTGYWTRVKATECITRNADFEKLKKSVLGYDGFVLNTLQCSACRKVTLVDRNIRYQYCPHCGAKLMTEV